MLLGNTPQSYYTVGRTDTSQNSSVQITDDDGLAHPQSSTPTTERKKFAQQQLCRLRVCCQLGSISVSCGQKTDGAGIEKMNIGVKSGSPGIIPYYPNQRIFTVQRKNLQTSGYYWCAVEIGDYNTPDFSYYLDLSVQSGVKGYTAYSSWSKCTLTIFPGGSVTIPCHYDKKYTQQKKYWHSEIDKSITYVNTTEQNLSVIDHPDQSLFTVTMRNLQDKHKGPYYCAVETGEQPANVLYNVYLKIQSAPDVSVASSSASGHEGGDISIQCLYSSGYHNKHKQWCRYKDQRCYTIGRTDTSRTSSVQINEDDGRRSFTVLMTGLRLTDSGWYFCSVGEILSSVQLTVTEAERGIASDEVLVSSL
ncbi:polymeric immunoglobulin receptor-like [Garra rufa]|uniref:polymeric immunoglobulin receptor-like n=1 Tax=Garra rufa TaxID=137080 RepID=UPI003CCEE5D3